MRKYLKYLLFLIPVISLAQNQLPPDSNKKKKKKENYDLFRDVSIIDHPHEIKFDVLSLALDGRIHLAYEFQHRLQWYYGLSMSYHQNTNRKDNFIHDNFHYLPKIDVNPYVRYAFTDDQKKFYFVEGFLSINNGDHKDLERIDNGTSAIYKIKYDKYTDLAAGLAVGFKIIVKKRFIIDAYAGGGANLFNQASPKYIPRIGANVGYCF
jgi:hypothetical protein